MTKEYDPAAHSIVQAFLKPDAVHRYEVSDFVEALIFGIIRELERVYWNWSQESLEDREDWQLTGLPNGLEYRRYYWGDEEELCGLPNLAFGEVVINWYKRPGRGMSTNKDWDEAQWRKWFDQALVAVRLYDTCMQVRHHAFRDEDAGLKAFSTNERVQCKDCKYCMAFGANCLIWNREGSSDVRDAES